MRSWATPLSWAARLWWTTGLGLLLVLSGCRSRGEETTSGGGMGGSGGSGGAPLPEPRPLKFANWNLHDFFNDELDDPVATQEVTDAGWVSHREAVGRVMRALDADIVVVQEAEHQGVLEELNDLELDSRYIVVHLDDANDPRGIDIGLMSKVPIDRFVSHKTDEFEKLGTQSPSYHYSRDCLEAHLTYNERPLAVLGVHFRAKVDDDPNKRLAEAQHTRAIADAIVAAAPGTGIVILGDFNDLPPSPPYAAIAGAAPDIYENAPDHLPVEERWTFNFNGNLELVDHQMANPRLAGLIDPATVRILQGPEVEAASDHNPIEATYMVQ